MALYQKFHCLCFDSNLLSLSKLVIYRLIRTNKVQLFPTI